MPLNAVIFDLDDTLVYDQCAARASLRAAAGAVPDLDPERLEQAVLTCAYHNWRDGPYYRLCQELGFAPWEGLWSKFEGCHPRVDALRDWAPYYRERTWSDSLAKLGLADSAYASTIAEAYVQSQNSAHAVIDGAQPVVRALVGQYRLGLLTNGPADIQRLKLDRAGLADCFDTVLISGVAGAGKPSPEVFGEMLHSLDVSATASVMVGDSWKRDIEGAIGAGMSAIWIASGRLAPSLLKQVRMIASIQELPAALAES